MPIIETGVSRKLETGVPQQDLVILCKGLEMMAQSAPTIICLQPLDREEGEILLVNPQLKAKLGFGEEEWRNPAGAWLKHLHPDDRPLYESIAKTQVETQEPSHCQYRLITAEGRTLWIEDTVSLLTNQDGTPCLLLSVMRDITAEVALAQERVLAEVLIALSRTEKQDELLEIVGKNIWQLITFDSAVLHLVDDEGNIQLHRRWNSSGQLETLAETGHFTRLEQADALSEIAATEQSLVIPDTTVPGIPWTSGEDLEGGKKPTLSYIGIPLIVKGKIIGILSLNNKTRNKFNSADLEILEPLTAPIAVALERARLFAEIEELARTDPLTGLNNQIGFYGEVSLIHQLAIRNKKELAVCMADGDDFKDVNDTYGHAVGDQVIKETAKRIRSGVRKVDVLWRYGGEEIVAALPETGLHGAQIIAEKLRRALSDISIQTTAGSLQRTVSIGVAALNHTLYPKEPMEDLITRADKALYVVKKDGKNAVGVYIPNEKSYQVAVYRYNNNTNSWNIATYDPIKTTSLSIKQEYQVRRRFRLDLESEYKKGDYDAYKYKIIDTTNGEELHIGYLDFSQIHYSLEGYGEYATGEKMLSPQDKQAIRILFPSCTDK